MREIAVATIERHTREYLAFDVCAKSLAEYFRGHEMSDSDKPENHPLNLRAPIRQRRETQKNVRKRKKL